ncbi:MAG: glycosyltransferase family 2 protein [Bacteroidetes bacterium]|nr:MAG: glycosyltransferase family 2 protein [Bacteroidota bacterium]
MTLGVIIPAFDPGPRFRELLDRLSAVVPPSQVLVVDDGSREELRTTAESAGTGYLRHERNRGKGAALRSGFAYWTERGADAVVTMDADLQHAPEDIPRFAAETQRTGCDIVIGDRLHDVTGMPPHRRLSNTLTTFLVGLRTGVRVPDSQSGFRLIRSEVLAAVRTESDGFEMETEFLIAALSKRFTVGSVPIATVYAGERSHMTHFRTTVNFISVLLKR